MKFATRLLLVLSLVCSLSACAIHDDFAKTTSVRAEDRVAYVITEQKPDGTAGRSWQVTRYTLGKFPPRITFTDPANQKRLTLTGSFTVDDVTLPSR